MSNFWLTDPAACEPVLGTGGWSREVGPAATEGLLMSDPNRTILTIMRRLFIGFLFYASIGFTAAQTNIRQVDFKDFTYPLNGPLLGHDRLQWLPMGALSNGNPIHLVNGEDLTRSSSFVMDGHEYTQWAGFALQSVEYAEVTGDGREEAIVVIHYLSGGTQKTHYVYIYSFADGKPKLLAYFHTGDRAYSGLSKVSGVDGKLVVELFDPEKKTGDCCSSGIVRTRYKWHSGRFEAFGKSERETLDERQLTQPTSTSP